MNKEVDESFRHSFLSSPPEMIMVNWLVELVPRRVLLTVST
jgi:hypothetical protein